MNNASSPLIFIVDDEKHVLNMVGEVISKAGYRTRLYTDAT